MEGKNNNGKMNKNNSNDIFDSFKKDNGDIDLMLKDAFSFMESDDSEAPMEEYYKSDKNEAEIKKQDDMNYYETEENSMYGVDSKAQKQKKTLYAVLISVLSILIVLLLVFLIVFNGVFGNIFDEGNAGSNSYEDGLAEDEDFETMYGVSNAADLNDALKQWATNGGEIMESKNVINILLIGQDGSGGENSNGLADSLIIASVNKTTKTITLASVMRDSYTYFNVDGKDRYNKINASCVYGGPKGVIKTIENNYKINIDYYASVYFDSFKGVIDALGGVEVPIEPGFAAYINRTTRHTVSSGDAVLLNGEEALVYARIRKYYSDSDVSRTNNQRRVINAIMQKARGASVTELYKVVEAVLPYVKTNMKQSKILSYGTQALSEGWVNYEMQQETFPTQDTRGSANISYAGSCWVVDYPLAAQQMQLLLYGKTNIKLDANRVNVLTNYLTQKTDYNNNSSSSVQTLNNYTGEDSTTEPWTGEYESETTATEENTTSRWEWLFGTTAPSDVTDPVVTDQPETDPIVTDPTQEETLE